MGVAEGKNLDEWIPEFARPADALFLISQAQLILHETLIQCSVVSTQISFDVIAVRGSSTFYDGGRGYPCYDSFHPS